MHPVLIELWGIRVYGYGTLIALGGLLSGWFLSTRRRRMGLEDEGKFLGLFHAIFIGGFLGGRVLHLIEYVPREEWLRAFFSWQAGFSVLGAFAGVTLGVWGLCRWHALNTLSVFDYVCQVAPFWHAFGRLGCFLAGCCHGRPADGIPWAVAFRDTRAMVPPELLGVPLHPTQLYEAAGDLALAAVLYRFVLTRVEAGRLPPGSVWAGYFAGYGLLRFMTELWRGDTVPLALGLTAGQAGSLGLLAAGAAVRLVARSRRAPTY